ARSMRPSSGSSGHRMTAGPSRSVRSSNTRACEGPLAIGLGAGHASDSPGRRKAATAEAHRATEAIWRIESARLIAGLARVLGGLTTDEIARAFLVPVPTIAQRIVRAKRTLAEAHVKFEVPRGAERVASLASVLEVIYLIFNEGYSATAGTDWVRPALCEEALRLGRILAELIPTEPEVHGLVALMEIQASRLGARIGPSGEPVLLLDQDRALWDHLLIRRGLAALERAERLGGAMGPYALQAAIAACHARAATAAETDWPRIVALYHAVAQLAPSPVVELNRAVAVGMAFGPAAGLDLVDALVAEPSLRAY